MLQGKRKKILQLLSTLLQVFCHIHHAGMTVKNFRWLQEFRWMKRTNFIYLFSLICVLSRKLLIHTCICWKHRESHFRLRPFRGACAHTIINSPACNFFTKITWNGSIIGYEAGVLLFPLLPQISCCLLFKGSVRFNLQLNLDAHDKPEYWHLLSASSNYK